MSLLVHASCRGVLRDLVVLEGDMNSPRASASAWHAAVGRAANGACVAAVSFQVWGPGATPANFEGSCRAERC